MSCIESIFSNQEKRFLIEIFKNYSGAKYDEIIIASYSSKKLTIKGLYGSDIIIGSNFNDKITGGKNSSDENILVGSMGDDTLYSTKASDFFFFESNKINGNDIIISAGLNDVLVFEDELDINDFDFIKDSKDLVISRKDNNDSIKIKNYFSSKNLINNIFTGISFKDFIAVENIINYLDSNEKNVIGIKNQNFLIYDKEFKNNKLQGSIYNDIFKMSQKGKDTIIVSNNDIVDYSNIKEIGYDSIVLNSLKSNENLFINFDSLNFNNLFIETSKSDLRIYLDKEDKSNCIILKNYASKYYDLINVIIKTNDKELNLEEFLKENPLLIETNKSYSGNLLNEYITITSKKGISINSKEGDDTIISGIGNDKITAGKGKNTIEFGLNKGKDTIYLTKGENLLINFDIGEFSTIKEMVNKMSEVTFKLNKKDLLITCENSSITIKNFASSKTADSINVNLLALYNNQYIKAANYLYDLKYDVVLNKNTKTYNGSFLNEIIDSSSSNRKITLKGNEGYDTYIISNNEKAHSTIIDNCADIIVSNSSNLNFALDNFSFDLNINTNNQNTYFNSDIVIFNENNKEIARIKNAIIKATTNNNYEFKSTIESINISSQYRISSSENIQNNKNIITIDELNNAIQAWNNNHDELNLTSLESGEVEKIILTFLNE